MFIRCYGSDRYMSKAKGGDIFPRSESESTEDTASAHHRLWHLFIINVIWSHLGDIVQCGWDTLSEYTGATVLCTILCVL